MKKRFDISFVAILLVILFVGCALVISKGVRDQVDKGVTFLVVLKNPEAYRGKMVIWGGVIIEAKNQKEGTLIEVLQKPIDLVGQPKDVDGSDGRFLALYNGFLDVAVYAKGRELTVAGEVKEKRVLPLGEIEYAYPLVLVKEFHLWPDRSKEKPMPPPYWNYPWGWYSPPPRGL